LVTGGDDGLAIVWPIVGPRAGEAGVLLVHEAAISTVVFSPDAKWLATGSDDGWTRLWDLYSANLSEAASIFGGHTERVMDIAIRPDAREMATASLDRTVHVWNLIEPVPEPVILRQRAPVYAIAYTPDARYLVVSGGSQSTTATLYETSSAGTDPGMEVGTQTSPIVSVALAPDARWLATLERGSSEINLWDLTQPSASAIALRGHESRVTALTFSPDSEMLVSSDSNGSIRLWPMDAITDRASASDLQLPAALELACRTAGRNLTEREWAEYFPGEAYRPTCPD
jgi:WD40 repeat protein